MRKKEPIIDRNLVIIPKPVMIWEHTGCELTIREIINNKLRKQEK